MGVSPEQEEESRKWVLMLLPPSGGRELAMFVATMDHPLPPWELAYRPLYHPRRGHKSSLVPTQSAASVPWTESSPNLFANPRIEYRRSVATCPDFPVEVSAGMPCEAPVSEPSKPASMPVHFDALDLP